ncbi:hypothetical protein BAMA_13010 [Bacillus manliponensis]|uniref:Uncharacterized protein n=1 Tax=Bacillus manliponensis TaxID=574376 RepID=A0A073JTD1_9BACI|nr:hypothetical protein BAMA_13010 [Bacillus manliponensis]
MVIEYTSHLQNFLEGVSDEFNLSLIYKLLTQFTANSFRKGWVVKVFAINDRTILLKKFYYGIQKHFGGDCYDR